VDSSLKVEGSFDSEGNNSLKVEGHLTLRGAVPSELRGILL